MFFDLLDKGWPGELKPGDDRAYMVLLDGTDPDDVVQGLRRLLHRAPGSARPRRRSSPRTATTRAARRSPRRCAALRPGGVIRAAAATQRRYDDAGDRAPAVGARRCSTAPPSCTR
jgi:hypothetical protein